MLRFKFMEEDLMCDQDLDFNPTKIGVSRDSWESEFLSAFRDFENAYDVADTLGDTDMLTWVRRNAEGIQTALRKHPESDRVAAALSGNASSAIFEVCEAIKQSLLSPNRPLS